MDKLKDELNSAGQARVKTNSTHSITAKTAFKFKLAVTCGALLIIVAGVWFSRVKSVEQVAAVTTTVMPKTAVQVVKTSEGGIVKKVLVQNGEQVNRNQDLLVIDNTKYLANYAEAKSTQSYLMAKVARLKAQVGNAKSIAFPKELQTERYADLVARERSLFIANRTALNNSIKQMQANYTALNKEYKMVENLTKRGYASQVHLLKVQRQLHDVQRQMAERRDEFIRKSHQELNEAEAKLAALNESLKTKYVKVSQVYIRAPINGKVEFLESPDVGTVVKPDEPILRVVPKQQQATA